MTLPGPDWPIAWQGRIRYLPWRAVGRPNGTVGKMPVDQRGSAVNPLDRRAWRAWDAAWATVSTGQADGVGLAITPEVRLTAIDLDICLDEAGTLTSLARAVLETYSGAYAEHSPSGRGLHVLVRGQCPPGWRRQAGVEVIDCGFLTVTGYGYGAPHLPLPDHDAALRAWHAGRAASKAANGWISRVQPLTLPGDWFSRACQARNGEKFRALWEGRLADCPSASEGDLQLLLMVMYWWPTASDDELLTTLFESGRIRPKWRDERYLVRTLVAARRLCPSG